MCTVLREPHEVKARKQHRCDWCGKLIDKGETYTAQTIVGDGIYTWRECQRCKPYVKKMWWKELEKLLMYRNEILGQQDFEYFMEEEYPEVWKEWMGETR